MRSICRLCGLSLLLLPLLLWGQSGPSGLFDARVIVAGEGRQERSAAIREGLSEVLRRLTGRQDVLEEPQAEDVLESAERYLQQFGYQAGENADGETVRHLSLRFDGVAVERALTERGIAVWSLEDRPRMLIWPVIDLDGSREVVAGDIALAEQQLLRQLMAARGLPMLLPLMDLEDQQALRTSDLWGAFRDPILSASERYRPGAVVAARLNQRGGLWQGRWTLFWEGDRHEVNGSGESLEAAMAAGVDGIAGYLASRLGGVPNRDAGGVVHVRVEGLDSLDDYAWLQQLLQGVRGVVRSDPYRVTARYTDFRVHTDVDAERILRALSSSQRLAQADMNSGQEMAGGRIPDYFFRMR